MLSFFGIFLNNGYREFLNSIRNIKKFIKRKVNTMSLQVLCSPLLNKSWTNHPGKRVLPFTSGKKYCASMTVEAAIVLPLFVFLAIALLMPMKALDTERKIRTTMEKNCCDLSLAAYMENEENTDEGGDIILGITYRERIPFFSVAVNGLKTEISVKRRQWIGLNGKLKSNKNGSSGEENAKEMVYVGRNMGRYHKKRDCHYISNTYQTVSIAEATAMRDADGHRFTACSSCKGMIGKSGMVYVTPGGRHYHGSTDCSAMVSYVRKVPISEVLYLGVCSYCGGK